MASRRNLCGLLTGSLAPRWNSSGCRASHDDTFRR